jgi:putative transposase
MQKTEPLNHDNCYHIYNCGINGEDFFCEKMNYEHFLSQYEKYIEPVAYTFVCCLMGNLIYITAKLKVEDGVEFIKILNSDRSKDSVRFKVSTNPSESEGPDGV